MPLIFKASLRLRVALSIALPLLAVMSAFSFFQYIRETRLIQAQMEGNAKFVGDVIVSELMQAMAIHNDEMVNTSIQDLTSLTDVKRILIVNQEAVIKEDSAVTGKLTGQTIDTNSGDCAGCHQIDPNVRPRTLQMKSGGNDALRIATPIDNAPECVPCHDRSQKHVGVLLVDVSSQEAQRLARQNALTNGFLSVLATGIISIAIYFLLNLLLTRRINAFMKPLNAYANGDYEARLPVSGARDEIDILAVQFNEMICEIEKHIEEEAQRGELLRTTIIEERDRIARELHDSLPQLLAYLNTKIGAISLYVEKGKKKDALANLHQLEEASRDLLTDVRDAIHGLRASRLLVSGLAPAIQNYIDQFVDLCQIPVTFTFDPTWETIQLSPDVEVQALRIVQEALTNVRKHARATKAAIQMLFREGQLWLIITDDGIGFNPEVLPGSGQSHIGLQSIRERAESQQGKFMIQSQPGAGATLTVSLPVSKKP